MTCETSNLFGPVFEGDLVRFRLWAPAVPSASLEIEGNAPKPMSRSKHGWFEADVHCAPSTRYAFRVNGIRIPDPASRGQCGGAHGWSVLAPPMENETPSRGWQGRPWHEAVIYETHVGLEGGFARLAERFPSLRNLGITAIELMPVAAFPGERNWGYDGVLAFAPAEAYGAPRELKALVERAHELSLMVFLDVVYNHFGPDGNYIGLYAPQFFRTDIATPWGAAIDFRQAEVRRFFVENALYWIHEFQFDGLRLDAVHAISQRDWLIELAREVRSSVAGGRHVHLILENDNNDSELLRSGFDAQWNDDFHHVVHHLLTGERFGYYADHANAPAERLARALRDGFDYQGEFSYHRSSNRGTATDDLLPTAFISFLQNHDQIGNRAQGERLTNLADGAALKAAIALTLLCPQIPMLFLGDEIGSRAPFLYFTDHEAKLAKAVRKGRAAEFPLLNESSVPDPNAAETFRRSLPGTKAAESQEWCTYFRELLSVRHKEIVPRLAGAQRRAADAIGQAAVRASWTMSDGSLLTLAANLAEETVSADLPSHMPIWGRPANGKLPPCTTIAWMKAA